LPLEQTQQRNHGNACSKPSSGRVNLRGCCRKHRVRYGAADWQPVEPVARASTTDPEFSPRDWRRDACVSACTYLSLTRLAWGCGGEARRRRGGYSGHFSPPPRDFCSVEASALAATARTLYMLYCTTEDSIHPRCRQQDRIVRYEKLLGSEGKGIASEWVLVGEGRESRHQPTSCWEADVVMPPSQQG